MIITEKNKQKVIGVCTKYYKVKGNHLHILQKKITI